MTKYRILHARLRAGGSIFYKAQYKIIWYMRWRDVERHSPWRTARWRAIQDVEKNKADIIAAQAASEHQQLTPAGVVLVEPVVDMEAPSV